MDVGRGTMGEGRKTSGVGETKEMKDQPNISTKLIEILIGISILVGLYLTSLYSYPLFHSIAEIFSIVIAFCIFIIAWNSRQLLDNHYLLFIGIAYLFVGAVDLIHTLAYKGMNIFSGYDANLPTQLWIAGRYIESLSLLFAPFFINRKVKTHFTIMSYAGATTLLFISIFYWDIFPVCFVEGAGLTAFKKVSEYIISFILIVSLALLYRNRRAFDTHVLRWLILSIVLTIASELAFTFYISVYGLSNLVGHFFKVISFYLIYKALIETGLTKPYVLLFRNVKQSEEILKAANKELEAFSYSISHDLRGPLRAIDGFSQALMEDYADRMDESAKEYIGRIRAGARRMSELIDALLNLSRQTRGEMLREIVDLTALAKKITAELDRREPSRRVEFSIAEGVTANGNTTMLEVVMENLLGNAWKFTGEHLTARIEFGVTQKEGRPVYFVRDDGAGFDMAYQSKLFGAFQRFHTTEEFQGIGIGLATVQRIIHRHGGHVWAESEVEKGATFYFSLPAK